MVRSSADRAILAKFNLLRAELADRAYELECQGRCDAADITNELRQRLAEFAERLGATPVLPIRHCDPDPS